MENLSLEQIEHLGAIAAITEELYFFWHAE